MCGQLKAHTRTVFLSQGGDKLTPVPAALGISQAIVVDPVTGSLQGCSDARKDGAPLGY